MKMCFHEIIKAAALEFARANAVVIPGDFVTTQWGSWKKSHRVQICEVGAALAYGEFDRQKREFPAILEMFYTAARLRADGTLFDKPGNGIVLSEFITENGITWKQSRQIFNSVLVHWSLPESWRYVSEEGQEEGDS